MGVNVSINNISYNNVEKVKLPLSNGSGYAEFLLDGGGGSGALYSFLSGTYDLNKDGSTIGTFSINGNTVSVNLSDASATFCLTDYIATVATDYAYNVAKDYAEKFNIPLGASVTAKIKNITNPNNKSISFFGKETGTTTTFSFGTGNTVKTEDFENTITSEKNASINSVFMFIGAGTGASGSPINITATLELYVNGVRFY